MTIPPGFPVGLEVLDARLSLGEHERRWLGGANGWTSGFCSAVWDGRAVHRALGRASLARRFCVFGLPRAGGLAAEGAAAGLRMRHLPSAGIGDGGNSVSSDADGLGEVVSCRLSDGSRQARRLGQISAARTGGDVSDGLAHGP